MKKKLLLVLLIIPITTIFLYGCALRPGSGLKGGACYWKNKVRYDLPTKPTQSVSNSSIIKTAETSPALSSFNGDVFVAGFTDGGAYYWKNGEYSYLGGNTALDVFVEGNDVYVTGEFMTEGYEHHACYWKNSNRVEIDGIDARSIFVKNSTVYIAGGCMLEGHGYPCYWINDQRYLLNGNGVTGIFVDGSDVYVSGFFFNSHEESQGCYWKNGVRVELNNGNAPSILINNRNIYVSGGSGTDNSAALAISIDGTDVYIAGHYMRQTREDWCEIFPCFWKNGELFDLSIDEIDGCAYDIWASGSDLFVLRDIQCNPRLWYNGQDISLTGSAHAMYIVKR